MGVRPGPKSADGEADPEGAGGGEGKSGFDAIARYGVGEPDPVTGIYAVYDIPEEVVAPKVSIAELIEDWVLVVADFATEYQVRLAVVTDMTWREFVTLLTGLLSTPDSRIYRTFAQKHQEDDSEH